LAGAPPKERKRKNKPQERQDPETLPILQKLYEHYPEVVSSKLFRIHYGHVKRRSRLRSRLVRLTSQVVSGGHPPGMVHDGKALGCLQEELVGAVRFTTLEALEEGLADLVELIIAREDAREEDLAKSKAKGGETKSARKVAESAGKLKPGRGNKDPDGKAAKPSPKRRRRGSRGAGRDEGDNPCEASPIKPEEAGAMEVDAGTDAAAGEGQPEEPDARVKTEGDDDVDDNEEEEEEEEEKMAHCFCQLPECETRMRTMVNCDDCGDWCVRRRDFVLFLLPGVLVVKNLFNCLRAVLDVC
jgi:hypothetical protein